METVSGIDAGSCTRCGRCVRVCPSHIFAMGAEGVRLQRPETCIFCGHCVDACAEGAVVHPAFPPEKVHPIDYTRLPTPASLMELIKARRSNRAFTKEPIPEEALRQILEAAHAAPTASNSQNVGFTLITDPAALETVKKFTVDGMVRNLRKLKNPLLKPVLKAVMPGAVRYIPAFERIRSEYAAGKDPILRGAAALIFIHTPAGSRFGEADANLAYQNGSLMAQALGVSQVYTGFVIAATRQRPGKLEKLLGIGGTVRAGMALGLPSFQYPNYTDREEIKIQNI